MATVRHHDYDAAIEQAIEQTRQCSVKLCKIAAEEEQEGEVDAQVRLYDAENPAPREPMPWTTVRVFREGGEWVATA